MKAKITTFFQGISIIVDEIHMIPLTQRVMRGSKFTYMVARILHVTWSGKLLHLNRQWETGYV